MTRKCSVCLGGLTWLGVNRWVCRNQCSMNGIVVDTEKTLSPWRRPGDFLSQVKKREIKGRRE